MPLVFDKLSPLGTRDVAVSLVGDLEVGETIGTVDVTSTNTALLVVSNIAVNTIALDQDGITAAIGKAVTFTLTGQISAATSTVQLYIDFTGTSGSADRYTVSVPMGNLTS